MSVYSVLPLLFEAGSAIAGFICYEKIKGSYWRWFPIYLAVITAIDIAGNFLSAEDNHILFNNFGIPLEFLFFIWIFHHAFKASSLKWLPGLCAFIYVLGLLYNVFYFEYNAHSFYWLSYMIGNLVLLVLVLAFFIRLVTSNAILAFRNDILFWTSLGLLIFYLGTFPFYGLFETVMYDRAFSNVKMTYKYLMPIFNCLMYFMFTIGFICKTTTSRSLYS